MKSTYHIGKNIAITPKPKYGAPLVLIVLKSLIIRIKFVWYDMWIGAYYDSKYGHLYVCLIPMFPIIFQVYKSINKRKKNDSFDA